MLKVINKIFTGDLLKILCDMGHGDELVIVDANFPAETMGKRVIKLPGSEGTEILEAVLELFPLDHILSEPVVLLDMEPKDRKTGMETPEIWKDFQNIVNKKAGSTANIGRMSRQEFYNRSKQAYAIIQTGEERLYGDILLVKGVIK